MLFIFNDEVHGPVIQLDGQTIPAEERHGQDLVGAHHIDMFSQHPESGGDAPEDDALDLVDAAAGLGAFVLKFFIHA